MSDLDSTVQSGIGPVITIGFKTGCAIAVVLRDFLNYWYLQSQNNGEKVKGDKLNEIQGHGFKDHTKLEALIINSDSGIYREPVSKEDRKRLASLCKTYGVDYSLCKRPQNLDQLAYDHYVKGVAVNPETKKLLEAFTCLGSDGKPIFEQEVNGKRVPKLRDDEYLLTFAEKDIPKWNLICTNLEAYSTRTMGEMVRDLKAKETIKSRAQETGTPVVAPVAEKAVDKSQPNQKSEKDEPEYSAPVQFTLMKGQSYTEDKDTVQFKVTQNDFIYIPIRFVKKKDGVITEISIPLDYPVDVGFRDNITKLPFNDVKHRFVQVPVAPVKGVSR